MRSQVSRWYTSSIGKRRLGVGVHGVGRPGQRNLRAGAAYPPDFGVASGSDESGRRRCVVRVGRRCAAHPRSREARHVATRRGRRNRLRRTSRVPYAIVCRACRRSASGASRRCSPAEGARCFDIEPLRNEPQDFTITGGTGLYAGAFGSGTVERSLAGDGGTERWTATLVAPEIEFDVTPPTLAGAQARTVHAPKGAKRARVTYRVVARDAADGELPAPCQPRSGSRFMIGRTVVTCSATDTSANTRTTRFRITVKATP